MNHFITVPIQESSHTAEARRTGAVLADRAGFSQTEAGKLAIVLTEAATNILKHAGSGEILLRLISMDDTGGVELLALDKGPGMANIQECLRDGYSTGGSPGTGLGAITRQSAFFDLYSGHNKGTALFMQFWSKPPRPSPVSQHIEVGGLATCKHGEEVCGDGWSVKYFVDSASLLISDGLGHGDPASQATHEAIRIFQQHALPRPAEMLKLLDQGLKSSRGAAAAVIEANATTGNVRYAGVGNTTGAVVSSSGTRHMVSYNGTLGHRVQKVQELNYEWPAEALLVFMTDGLLTQWSMEGYPGLALRHPTLIAAVLYRDFNRGRDDATVVVARRRAA